MTEVILTLTLLNRFSFCVRKTILLHP